MFGVFEVCMLQQLAVSLEERLVLVDRVPRVGLGLSSAQGQQAAVLLSVGSDGAVGGALEKVYTVVAIVAVHMLGSDSLERDSPAEVDTAGGIAGGED